MRIITVILFYIAFLSVPFVQCVFANTDLQTQEQLSVRDWSGYHSGLLLGAEFGESRHKTGGFGYNSDNDKWTYHQSGLNAAGEFGYNYKWNQLIVGPKIELGYINLKGQGTQSSSPGYDTVGRTSSDLYSILGLNIGKDFNHYLVYITGGRMGVNYTQGIKDSCNTAPCGGGIVNTKDRGLVWGYALGGGVERFVQKDWSIKLESIYFNLNKKGFKGSTDLGNTYRWNAQTYGYIFRCGVNYYF